MTAVRALAALLALCSTAGCAEGPCNPRYEICPDPSGDEADLYTPGRLVAEYAVDPSLADAEVDALSEAAEMWAAATGGRVRLDLVTLSPGEPLPERRVARRALPGDLEPGQLAAYGAEAIVVSERAASSPHLLSIMVHELGHRAGLGHEPDPSSIMYGNTHEGMPRAPTEDAVEDLRRTYGW